MRYRHAVTGGHCESDQVLSYPWIWESGAMPKPESVPNGTVTEIIDWVAGDPDRAFAAYTVEQARPQPRKSLLEALAKVP